MVIIQASWIHGNAVTVEDPQNLSSVITRGWGVDLTFSPGKASWFHIPIPTPVIISDQRVKVQRLYLLFESQPGLGDIRNIAIYDGLSNIQGFDNVFLSGPHRTQIDSINTIILPNPHEVQWGMSISFQFIAATGFDTNTSPSWLTIASAGADFF